MKKMIALFLSLVVLVACLVVARWAQNNTRVNSPDGDTSTTAPGTNGGPADIENGLGWG